MRPASLANMVPEHNANMYELHLKKKTFSRARRHLEKARVEEVPDAFPILAAEAQRPLTLRRTCGKPAHIQIETQRISQEFGL